MMTDQQHSVIRARLLSQLLEAVKQCQIRYGGKTELATESDGHVMLVCHAWEAVFQHGLKQSNKGFAAFRHLTEVTRLTKLVDDSNHKDVEPAFWCYVRCHLSATEEKRCMVLKNVKTDTGRGKAWLRSTLNEHSLEKYLHYLIGSKELLSQYYEVWAFMRDEERCAALPNTAAGLSSILFAFNIDNPSFNINQSPGNVGHVVSNPTWSDKFSNSEQTSSAVGKNSADDGTKERRRKKKPAKIVTFDDTDVSSLSASPGSSVVSPFTAFTAHQSRPSANKIINQSLSDSLMTETDVKFASENVISRNASSSTSESSGNTAGEIFSFDSYEKSKAVSSVARTDSNRDNSKHDSVNVLPEDCDIYSMSISNPNKNISPSTNTASESSHFNSRTTDVNDVNYCSSNLSSCDISNVAVNKSGLVIKSHLNGIRKSELRHSRSDPSSCSVLSRSYTSDDLIFPDMDDARLSLVPLNADGKPVEFNISSASVDGDTTSGSYGSYDSRDIIIPDESSSAFNQTSFTAVTNYKTNGHDTSQSSASDSASLTYDELKEALVTMMLSKEEIQQQNKSLQKSLEQEMGVSASLRSELDEVKQLSEQQREKDAERFRNMTKENELLKHQLRKYVGAVQLLRRQGASAEDFPGIHLEPLQPAIPPPRSSADYNYESEEYEKKLIQVAEMHGELMEFNDLLQKQLLVRESQVKHLSDELVSLRGPLPEDTHTISDDLLDGSFDPDVASIAGHPLINIWIPSAFLRGNAREVYHVYQVYVRIRDEEWNVFKRYSEFFELHNKLRKKHPAVDKYNFPPKKTFGKKELKTVEERRKKLQNYLRSIITLFMETSADLSERPNKQKLIEVIPFFGDVGSGKNERSRSSRRNIELGNVSS